MGQIWPSITRPSRLISFVLSAETSKLEKTKVHKMVVNKREENLTMITIMMTKIMKLMNKRLPAALQLCGQVRHLEVKASG